MVEGERSGVEVRREDFGLTVNEQSQNFTLAKWVLDPALSDALTQSALKGQHHTSPG